MDPVVIIGTPEVTVQPGGTVRVPVRVKNLDRRITAYDIEVLGDAAEWARPEQPVLTVRARGAEEATGIIFTPPPGAAVASGDIPFAVRATSKVDGARATGEGVITVAAGPAVLLSVAPEAQGRWRAKFPVSMQNTGNAPVRLALTGFDPKGGVEVTVEDDVHSIDVGGEATATIAARLRSPRLRGAPTPHQLTVETRSHPFGAPAPEPGPWPPPATPDPVQHVRVVTLQQKPILTRGVTMLLALLPLLIIGLIVSRFFTGDDHEPGLATPEAPVGVAAVADSESVLVSWQPVSGAIAYEVRVDNNPAVPVEGAVTNSFQVAELDPETEYAVSVRSLGPEGAGNSEFGDALSVTTDSPPALTVPTGLAWNDASSTLSWSHDPGEFSVDDIAYTVFVDGKESTSVTAGVTSTALAIEPGRHEVRVRASLEDIQSDLSAVLVVDVTAPADPGAGAGGANGPGGGGDDGGPDDAGNGGDPADLGGEGGRQLVVLHRFVPGDPLAAAQTAEDLQTALDGQFPGATVGTYPAEEFESRFLRPDGTLRVIAEEQAGSWVFIDRGFVTVTEMVDYCAQLVDAGIVSELRCLLADRLPVG